MYPDQPLDSQSVKRSDGFRVSKTESGSQTPK
jgi:hypothetical protein